MKQSQLRNTKTIAILLFGLVLISLIPVWVLGRYDYCAADDYSFSAAARAVLVQTGSVWNAVKAAAGVAYDRYYTWQGTYTSIFLMALQPAVWGAEFYHFVPLLLSVLLLTGGYLFWYRVGKSLEGNVYPLLVVSGFMMIAWFQLMPSPVEGLYWFNGAVHYELPFFFLLILGTIWMLRYRNGGRAPGRKKRILLEIITLICLVFLAGGNLITGLLCAICEVVLTGLILLAKEKQKLTQRVAECVIYFALFVINIAAPGNAVREESAVGMDPLHAVLISFRDAVIYPARWSGIVLPLLLLCALPFLLLFVKSTTFRFPLPGVVLLFSYCLLAAAFTPSLYAISSVDAGRIQNVIFELYVLLLFLNTGYLLGWFLRDKERESGQELSIKALLVIFVLLVFLLGGFVFGLSRDIEEYVSVAAVYELKTGDASSYGEKMEQRISILSQAEGDNAAEVEIPALTVCPLLLFYADVTDDSEDWTNLAMARFYQIGSVKISP